MLRKIFAIIAAAAVLICLSGCSEYVMTEEDLAIYKSIQGYWAADAGTDYNQFDENGSLKVMTVVEFTDDFNYLMHMCYIDQGYALTYPPVKYSFEDRLFKVMTDGVASYAQLSVSDDGQMLYWHTDNRTDTYLKIDSETALSLGIAEYNPKTWVTDENGSYITEAQSLEESGSDNGSYTEAPAEDGSETDSSETDKSATDKSVTDNSDAAGTGTDG